jgi:aryl-alcohol dehydrogenase-like predicted oxidoreductase
LAIEALDVFCMSRVDPNVPVEESVGGMAELVGEGKILCRFSAFLPKLRSALHAFAATYRSTVIFLLSVVSMRRSQQRRC